MTADGAQGVHSGTLTRDEHDASQRIVYEIGSLAKLFNRERG